MARSVLLMLSQLPQDTAGGAVRSLRTMCEWLAAAPGGEFRVACLGTTASDHAAGLDARAVLREEGCGVYEERPRGAGERPVLRFTQRGIEYAVLDTGSHGLHTWNAEHGEQYGKLLRVMLDRLEPDVVLTMGAIASERERHKLCRERGAAVVLGVRQHGYYDIRAFAHVDDALMCSDFLVRCYEERIGYRGSALPVPIEPEDVVAPERTPLFLTMINPTREKGVMLLARMAEDLGSARPDIPLMVVESRGLGGSLVRAGLAGGFDLRRHRSIMVSPGVAKPRHIYAATRVLLFPSVWEEPAGRVVAEAMMNGVPAIVSDRGGVSEVCGDAGFVIGLPAGLEVKTETPCTSEGARPWVEMVQRLWDDPVLYAEASARARRAGEAFMPGALAPRYYEYFRSVRRRDR
ncbi:MAG: glycosyltransferase [Planctomycetota bacterium]|nr:glycosyltransferase [Planctomycetota bacterium]